MAAVTIRPTVSIGAQARCAPERTRAFAPCSSSSSNRHGRQAIIARAGDEEEPFTADDLLKTADDLMIKIGAESSGEFPTINLDPTPIEDAVRLHCDEHGCTIISAQDTSAFPELVVNPIDMIMWEGAGWKLGCDRHIRKAKDFSGIIAGEGWSFMINQAEYNDMIKLLHNMRATVESLDLSSSSPSDETTLETETEHVWLQGRALNSEIVALQQHWTQGAPMPASAFSLSMVIRSKGARDVEAFWCGPTVMEVLHKVVDGKSAVSEPTSGAHA